MATVTVNDSNLYDIADSIRAKLGVQTTYKPSEMADAIDSISGGGITPTGEIEITANGTYDVTNYASADVDVPNTYTSGDEGKVVSNGALVAQTSDSVTQNGIVDTTLINSLTVNVSGGGSTVYKGEFTPTERQQTVTFYAPGCTYLAVGAKTKPDLTTGKGFVYSVFCSVGRYDSARSNNSGASIAGSAFETSNASVSYANDTFTLYWATFNDTAKVFQPGITYTWCAW